MTQLISLTGVKYATDRITDQIVSYEILQNGVYKVSWPKVSGRFSPLVCEMSEKGFMLQYKI